MDEERATRHMEVIPVGVVIAVPLIVALYLYAFWLMFKHVGKCGSPEDDVTKRSRELKLPLKKR